ncbi:MAG TPA: hypothetical protein VK574_03065 [Terracidiphilus sp.]|nr:hypothetical protein [Terracidiphilus sp.]
MSSNHLPKDYRSERDEIPKPNVERISTRLVAVPKSEQYVAESVFNPKDIMSLATSAKRIIGDELGTLSPQFFLNSIPQEGSFPRVVVVRRAGAVIGLFYAKELKLAGFRTGLICGDASDGPIIACKPEEQEAVWSSALSHLLTFKTVLGIRLAIPYTEYELYAGERIVSPIGAVASYREYSTNAMLALPSSYEALLSQMGSHTRRNFRYYRRQFETQGHAYVEPLTIPEFRTATRELIGKSSIPAKSKRVEIDVRMCLAADRPMLIGLRSNSGEWLATLGGWYVRDQATVRFQMNRDQEHRADSLSVVLRGYLIESLIRRGFQSIVFIRGVGEPLKRYCRNVPTVILYLDKPNRFLRPARFLELAARLAPPSLAFKAVWLAKTNLKETPTPSAQLNDPFDPTLQ